MKIVNIVGEDIGEENWRISISKSGDKIIIKTMNFKCGFKSGEAWDKIYTERSSSFSTYTNYVSVITKDKSKLESFRPIIIEEFYNTLEFNILNYLSEIKKIEGWINSYQKCLDSDLFKDKLRNDKLDKLLVNNGNKRPI